MYINIVPQKAYSISMELLDVSRSLRQFRKGVEDVQYQMRALTELDACKSALRKQGEAIAELTARLVNMSAALREISEVYQNTEEKIQDTLEERPRYDRKPGKVIISKVNDTLHRQVQQILYK